MTSPISALSRDTFDAVLSFLSSYDVNQSRCISKIWKKYIDEMYSLKDQVSHIRRFPKILQQNLPNRKLPILDLSENINKQKINFVKPDMMSHSIMLISDPLHRQGVALKYFYKRGETEGEAVIVLHKMGEGPINVWTSGQDSDEIPQYFPPYGLGDVITTKCQLEFIFQDGWNITKGVSHLYIPKLLNGLKCGLVKQEFRNCSTIISEDQTTDNSFLRLSN